MKKKNISVSMFVFFRPISTTKMPVLDLQTVNSELRNLHESETILKLHTVMIYHSDT